MRNFIIITILLFGSYACTLSQGLSDYHLDVYIGGGNLTDCCMHSSFEIRINRHLTNELYGIFSFTKKAGSESFENFIKDFPLTNERAEINEHIYASSSDPAQIIHQSSYAFGVEKHIRTGADLLIHGSLLFAITKIGHQSISGINYNNENILLVEDLYPTFENYLSVGVQANLGLRYFIHKDFSFGSMITYLSHPSTFQAQIGISTWF